MITRKGEDRVRRSTAGNQVREGNDGKPDIVSVNENNGLSSPPASFASETQKHLDNTGDPSTDGEAAPGSTLSVDAAHSPVPSNIGCAQDVDGENTEIVMSKRMWTIPTSPDSTTLREWKENVKVATLRLSSKQQTRDHKAGVTASTTAQARDPQLTTASVRSLRHFLYKMEISSRTLMALSSQTRTVGKVNGQFLHARWWL